jgi:hypothetical protein
MATPSRIASLAVATVLVPFFEAVRQHDRLGAQRQAPTGRQSNASAALRDAAHPLPQLAPLRTLYGAMRLGDPQKGERIEPYIRARLFGLV